VPDKMRRQLGTLYFEGLQEKVERLLQKAAPQAFPCQKEIRRKNLWRMSKIRARGVLDGGKKTDSRYPSTAASEEGPARKGIPPLVHFQNPVQFVRQGKKRSKRPRGLEGAL